MNTFCSHVSAIKKTGGSKQVLTSKLTIMLITGATFIFLFANPMKSFGAAAGGPSCGWGNMLFQGDKGKVPHAMAFLTNGASSANAFFGIILGTNGCESDGVLSYSGEPMLGLNHILDELAEDIALGDGEALSALSLALKIQKQDRSYFKQVMNKNFTEIFIHEDINAKHVMQNIVSVMAQDIRLNGYLS